MRIAIGSAAGVPGDVWRCGRAGAPPPLGGLDFATAFPLCSGMADQPLRPATDRELCEALVFALRFSGRKRHHHADGFMAELAAEKLVEHLRRSGFIVMRRPPAPAPSASPHLPE